MVIKILLVISIALQLVAAFVALRLTKRTKFNVAWLLFTAALMIMCVMRIGDWFQFGDKTWKVPDYFFVWLGIATSLCFATGVFYVSKIFDMIEKMDYQRRLTERRILSTVLRTEENERSRFSSDLHDGLGPLLSSARMSLSVLAKKEQSTENKELIDSTMYVIDEAIHSLREISNNLSPHILRDFGLGRAVGNFINKSISLGDIKVNYDTNLRSERFDVDIEIILYRVICELINNSIRHSGCSHINLALFFNADRLILNYSDDGHGFDYDSALGTGMGLSNISSRIASLKGTFDLKSVPQQGMSVAVTVSTKRFAERDARKGRKDRKIS